MLNKKVLTIAITVVVLSILAGIGFNFSGLSNYSRRINVPNRPIQFQQPIFNNLPKPSIPKPPVFY